MAGIDIESPGGDAAELKAALGALVGWEVVSSGAITPGASFDIAIPADANLGLFELVVFDGVVADAGGFIGAQIVHSGGAAPALASFLLFSVNESDGFGYANCVRIRPGTASKKATIVSVQSDDPGSAEVTVSARATAIRLIGVDSATNGASNITAGSYVLLGLRKP